MLLRTPCLDKIGERSREKLHRLCKALGRNCDSLETTDHISQILACRRRNESVRDVGLLPFEVVDALADIDETPKTQTAPRTRIKLARR